MELLCPSAVAKNKEYPLSRIVRELSKCCGFVYVLVAVCLRQETWSTWAVMALLN